MSTNIAYKHIPTTKKEALAVLRDWIAANRCPLFVFGRDESSEPHMRRLAELAKEQKLLKFAGNCLWFEQRIVPPAPDGSFEQALARVRACLHGASRHRNHFGGFVTLDISDQTDCLESKHFAHMLRELVSLPGTFFGLALYSGDEKVIREAESALARIVSTTVFLAPDWQAETPKGRAMGFVFDGEGPNSETGR
jgi:hypothetical protein